MRRKIDDQRYFDLSGESSVSIKVVREYRSKYEAISDLLEANRPVLDLAHRDLSKWLSSSRGGRSGQYTSEQIIRSLIVMFVEGDSYRDVVVRIETSEFLRNFVRLGIHPMMDYSFLSKAYGVLSPSTWEAINGVLSAYACGEEKITGEQLRLDSTAYEVNIHYPTDSSLLWDGFRTLADLLRGLQQTIPDLGLNHRYHVGKIKNLSYFIARNAGSGKKRTQRKVQKAYRTQIDRVRGIVGIAYEALTLAGPLDFDTAELAHYVPIVERIIDQAERRIFNGEMVPADEKVYSLFEEHTELLQRGKAGKPIEFGHKILIAQTGEKFIHHYQVLPKRMDDTELLEPTLQAHEQLFGVMPDVLAADKGFYKSTDQLAALETEIETVSIGKKGRRNETEYDREHTDAFKAGQCFRAGSEGSISVLKRAFKLGKCLFKGFKNYAASVGCAIFCHNLVLLTRL